MAENNDTAPLPETWEERRDRARQIILTWLPEIEDSNYQIGYRGGYRDGFTAGWDAHVEHMNRVFAEAEARQDRAPPEKSAPPPPKLEAEARRVGLTPTNNDLVLAFIQKSPGKRGVEIVKELGKGVAPIPERSVRTSLFRLKKATQIVNKDGRWYPAEEIPADPQRQEQEADMPPP